MNDQPHDQSRSSPNAARSKREFHPGEKVFWPLKPRPDRRPRKPWIRRLMGRLLRRCTLRT